MTGFLIGALMVLVVLTVVIYIVAFCVALIGQAVIYVRNVWGMKT